MKCARCEASIPEGEEREHLGRALCEDCYMDALSPQDLRPWRCTVQVLWQESRRKIRADRTSAEDTGDIEGDRRCTLRAPGRTLEHLADGPRARNCRPAAHGEVRGELRTGKKYIRLW